MNNRCFFAIICTVISWTYSGKSSVAQPLDSLFILVSNQNEMIQAAKYRYEAKMKEIETTGVLPNPSLSLGWFFQPVETRLGPQQGKVAIQQAFPWFGTLGVEKKRAYLEAKQAYQEWVLLRDNLFLSIAQDWAELWLLDRKRASLMKQISTWKAQASVLQTRYENQTTTMSALLRLQIKEAEIHSMIREVQYEQTVLQHRVNQKIGRPLTASLSISSELPPEIPLPEVSDSLLYSLPETQAIRFQEAQKEADIELAKLKGKPQVSIGLEYIQIGEREAVLSENGRDALAGMVSFSVPLWRKSIAAGVQQHRSQAKALQWSMRHQLSESESKIGQLLEKKRSKSNQLKLVEEQYELLLKVAEIEEQSFQQGNLPFSKVLETQRECLELELKGLEAKVRRWKIHQQLIHAYHLFLTETL